MTVSRRDLAAEAITVRIRWFGVCIGLVFVNLLGRETNQPVLNGILFLGAIYALSDTISSWRGRILLHHSPLVISAMEATFIGLLCHFDGGADSPFRFYYVLSLLVCAMRHSTFVTWATLGLHAIGYLALVLLDRPSALLVTTEELTDTVLTLTVMIWVTWASTSLTGLLRAVGERLRVANQELTANQTELQRRVDERTRELQQSQGLLVQQEKQAAFGLLAAGIAHEVGNPLAAISSLVQMLNRRDQDDYTRERLEMVDGQLARIQRTLRELVDFSRPSMRAVSVVPVSELIDEALSIAKYYKGKRGKTITTRCEDDLPRLRIVPDPLVQVLLNLVLNAMDATPQRGTIDLTARRDGSMLIIEVTDDGPGIEPSHRTHVFEPYFTTKRTGTGLGLFVCRTVLEALGGSISLVDSDPEQTRFAVHLPLDSLAAVDSPAVNEPNGKPSPDERISPVPAAEEVTT